MAVIYAKNKTTNEWERVSPQTVEIDDSLTIKGAPADAKATGDALEEIRNQTNDALEEIRNQIGDIDFSDINIEKPDWNQTDENAADFIKNKPFGEEIVEVFNTNTFDIQFEYDEEDNDYTYVTEGSKIFDIEEGKTYIVNYNGVEYNCVAYSIVGMYQCIGNAELRLDYPAGNGEPFVFMYVPVDGERQVLHCTECTDYPEISIKAINTKQIDSKYIKDMYYDNGITNTVIFEEQVIEGFQQENENMYVTWATTSELLNIVSGNTYLVNWDGVEYETVASLYEIYPYVGNGSYLTGNPSGDIPFFIACIGNTLMIYTNPSSESHTISITEVIHDKRQIDAKYLSIMKSSQSVFFEESIEGNEYVLDYSIGLEIGKTYSVILDGVQYDNLECYMFNGMSPCIGSMSDASIPFIIGSLDQENMTQIMIMTDGETHTLSIAEQSFVVDEKYLPSHTHSADDIEDMPDKLSDFENDLFYNKKISFLTLTKADFQEWVNPNDEIMYIYTGSPKIDWVSSEKDIAFTFSATINGESVNDNNESIPFIEFAKEITDDGESVWFYAAGLFVICNGYDFKNWDAYLSKDEYTINLMIPPEIFESMTDLNLEIFRTDKKIIDYDVLPELVGKNVTGTEYTINDESVIAGNGAEIFNDYKLNRASGEYSHAEGAETTASGYYSHAEGYNTVASGGESHAEGNGTEASGDRSHAEGSFTTASGGDSHAEGNSTIASGNYSHAEGCATQSNTKHSHAEGHYSIVTDDSSISVQGTDTTEKGFAGHAEGCGTVSYGRCSHAEGNGAKASGDDSHAEGRFTTASGDSSHAEGSNTKASGEYSHAEGYFSKASAEGSHAEGNSDASGIYSHAEGYHTTASGNYSHAEGYETTASRDYSHAEGYNTTASGDYSHAEGYSSDIQCRLTGDANSTTYRLYSYISGLKVGCTVCYGNSEAKIVSVDGMTIVVSNTLNKNVALDAVHAIIKSGCASGNYSHSEGKNADASGDYSHAEGIDTAASGSGSHAEGNYTTATGAYSHAENYYAKAYGEMSHAEGMNTIAASDSQHAQGKHNIADAENIYAHIVGNGTSNSKRSNAHTLDWSGNAWFSGDVYVGSTSGTNKDEGSKILATQEYVDIRVPAWTEADEGKVLRIVNGVPTWANIEITSTDDGAGNVVIS